MSATEDFPELGGEAVPELEAAIGRFGRELFASISDNSLSLFDRKRYTGKLMDWAMADEAFRVALFRFVDVLPSLESAAAVMRHAQEYFGPVADRFPGLAKWGLGVDPDSLRAKAAAHFVRQQIESMAHQFILGESPKKALKALRKIRKGGCAFTVDLLGEACVSDAEAAVYQDRYVELLETLGREVPTWTEAAPLVDGHRGEATPVNISVKLSALDAQAKPVAMAKTVDRLAERLAALFRVARAQHAFVYLDMEDTSKVDYTLQAFRAVLEDPEFRDWAQVGCVLQAYLRRTPGDLETMLRWARERGTPFAIRLVKGAYWDTETIKARLARWPLPVWQEKVTSDAAYEACARQLLDHADDVLPAFGSHNLRSLAFVTQYAEACRVPKTHYELQALWGMAEPIKAAFVERGYLVREYAPIGELLPGMAYLVRRLLENTSNDGFIRQGFREGEDVETLLRRPESGELEETGAEYLEYDPRAEFQNAPLRDFTIAAEREAIQRELDHWLQRPGEDYGRIYPIVGGKRVANGSEYLRSDAPENPDYVVAAVGSASVETVERALEGLGKAFPAWRDTSVEKRAEVLFRAADILERRRAALTALIILECGKPWAEADGDVAEAIDFCRYYARAARSSFGRRSLCELAGEEDHLFYEGRGVCAVIGPWNFPSAIPCGMFAAALVTGNTVALKPAEQSPVTAHAVFEAFLEAGMPGEVAAFLPGPGEIVGQALVESERVSTIVFTGSKAVGMGIIRAAAELREGQEHVKRVIAEMGGKNAIIIDEDADLDQAVQGVVSSAFGYAGQKCSACSRVYLVGECAERFLARLKDAVESLPVGPASDPATVVGPVIDDEAVRRLRNAVEGRAVLATAPLPRRGRGRYVAPVVIEVDDPGDRLLREELFGPVLAVLRVPDFETALECANRSEYGLTGAVFSRQPSHLERAAREFRVGNLYLNRGSTAALVGRQPFGGARHSGVGSKTGGPDYLGQFVLPRVVTENTLRQGFAPMDGD